MSNEKTVQKLRKERSNRSQSVTLSFLSTHVGYNVKACFPIPTGLGRVWKLEDGSWRATYTTPPSDLPIKNENGMLTYSCSAVPVQPNERFSSRQEAGQFLLSEWFAGRVA